MALKLNYTVSDILINQRTQEATRVTSETVKDAYWCITHIKGDKSRIKIIISIYRNGTKQAEDFLGVAEYNFTPNVDLGSTNFIQQGYEYLKTMPEFSDAVDC